MKRILTFAGCFFALTCACFAQDVIVTRDSKRINAIVTQVNVDNIRYKHFDNPNGSTYMLQKNDVVAILYQNGKVETFVMENKRTQTANSTPVQTQVQRTTQSNQYQIQRTTQTDQYDSYYRYTKRDLVARMQRENPGIYQQYRSGVSRTARGWAFIGTGIVMNGVGLGLVVGGTNKRYNYRYGTYYANDIEQIAAGCIISLVGEIFLYIGIPTAIGGKVRRVKAINAYEQRFYSNETTGESQFKINLHSNGLGLAYVF